MSTPTALAVLRAAVRQAAGDLRPVLVGAGLFSTILSAGVAVVSVVYFSGDLGKLLDLEYLEFSTGYGNVLAASLVGATGSLITVQIVTEAYTDRVGGALLRVRVLPHGPLTWSIGKAISCFTPIALTQTIGLIAVMVFIDALPLRSFQILASALIIVLSVSAAAPLGFLAASAARGPYSAACAALAVTALWGLSGAFYPLADLPRWVQLPQLALPSYWSGHLTRWALVGDPSWEVGGAFHPALAIGVLTAWTIIGFAVLPSIIRRSFRKESISGLARMQTAQQGL